MSTATAMTPAPSALLVRRICDGYFVKAVEVAPGVRRIEYTPNPAFAMRVDEETAARLCDSDFFGEPLAKFRKPEFERMPVELHAHGRKEASA